MLLYTMLYIVLAYLMLFAALTNSVCLNNASFFFLFKYFLCQGYELSGEIALKNNHYYYIIIMKVFVQCCELSRGNRTLKQTHYFVIRVITTTTYLVILSMALIKTFFMSSQSYSFLEDELANQKKE